MLWIIAILTPVAFVTVPFWLPPVAAFVLRPAYKQALFLSHSVLEEPDWQLSMDGGSHPTQGFFRMQSGMVEVLWWKDHMDWIEQRIVATALRRALKGRGLAQYRREVQRHDA